MYKLIAIDMDGTLLKEDKTVSERTKNTIKAAKEKGVQVCGILQRGHAA